MKRTIGLSFALLLFAACGDDPSPTRPDAMPDDSPDAEVQPDADTSCTTDTACVGQNAGAVLCNTANTATITCNQVGDCLDAVSTSCTGGDVCVDDGTPACETPAPTCKDDPECIGQTDGASLCVGAYVISCALTDGCLVATQAETCMNDDVCIDDGTPACETNPEGESCATARYVTGTSAISGADFGADFTDDQDYTDASCVQGVVDDLNVEGVYAVNLAAYQRITVAETGGMDAILGIQTTCGDTEACIASTDTPESLSRFVTEPTTLYIYVGAQAHPPVTTDYNIQFTITTCGDGTLDTTEGCDDGDNGDGDGCSATCGVEFGWGCDEASPTVCAAFPDLGMHGGAATISDTSTAALAAGDFAFYTVTFTEPVHLTGTITSTADADFYVYHRYSPVPTGPYYGSEDTDATTETIGDDFDWYFTPGTYVLAVRAYATLSTGYALSLTTVAPPHTDIGTFAPGDAITNTTGGAVTANNADYYTITFSAPVLLDGTLATTTTGDLDVFMWEPGNPVFAAATDDDESWVDAELPAGTYYLELWAFPDAGNVDGYTLTLSTTAVPSGIRVNPWLQSFAATGVSKARRH